MQKWHIKYVIYRLVDLIDSWNDACEDGDRGRCNDALTITIFDDGSGKVGTQFGEHFNPQFEFDNANELVEWLDQHINDD